MNKLEIILNQLKEMPESVEFEDVISAIDSSYRYKPVRFTNGPIDGRPDDCVINNAGENTGSCKIFAFALKHRLSEPETLHCFGKYYRDDVLQHPENSDHGNIRAFIKHGWQHVSFEKTALQEK